MQRLHSTAVGLEAFKYANVMAVAYTETVSQDKEYLGLRSLLKMYFLLDE